ncbi:hypothetical protein B0H16DRAFT_1693949 [Mycena metata]|uniref:Uncharacterized protein n=1 Tax=Mycena metata TaxID=1033252 RepID=A0AAD7IF50_9AGAR|nr:hypothetical protein B0H16DRAFT_1693949 [Mycena metata]
MLLLIAAIIHHGPEVIASTDGVRTLIVGGWRLIFDQPGGPHATSGYLMCVIEILTKMKLASLIHRNEFIQGAGGSIDDAATLLTRSLYHYFPTSCESFMHEGFLWIPAIFHPLRDLKIMDFPETKMAVLDAGFGGSLINIICVFTVSQLPKADGITLGALHLLHDMLEYSEEEWVLRRAVADGLLRGRVSCGVLALGDGYVVQLLRTSLSRGTIYRSVLSEISKLLPELDGFAKDPLFIGSTIFDAWTTFRALV